MVLARVVNLVRRTQRHGGIDNLILVGDEVNPFLIFGHGNRTLAQFTDNIHGVFGLSLKNTGIGVVRFLNLADDNRLKLSSRALKVQVGLTKGLDVCALIETKAQTYLVKIVLLVNLTLDLTVNGEAKKERILLARGGGGVNLILVENISKGTDSLGGSPHLLLYGVLEIARELLDFLDLLLQIASQAGEGEDDILFNLLGLLRFVNGSFVVRSKKLQSVIKAGRLEKAVRRRHIVCSVAELGQRFGTLLIVALNLAKVGNQVLEKFPPGCNQPEEVSKGV